MGKMEQIEIGFNSKLFNEKIKELENVAKSLNDAEGLSLKITEGNLAEISSSAIANWITSQTGFKSVTASASLLDVDKEYELFLGLESIYKPYNISNFEKVNDVWKVSKNALQGIKIDCTTYLNDDYLEMYKKLEKIKDILNNELPIGSIRFLQYDYDRSIKINLNLLHNQKFM